MGQCTSLTTSPKSSKLSEPQYSGTGVDGGRSTIIHLHHSIFETTTLFKLIGCAQQQSNVQQVMQNIVECTKQKVIKVVRVNGNSKTIGVQIGPNMQQKIESKFDSFCKKFRMGCDYNREFLCNIEKHWNVDQPLMIFAFFYIDDRAQLKCVHVQKNASGSFDMEQLEISFTVDLPKVS